VREQAELEFDEQGIFCYRSRFDKVCVTDAQTPHSGRGRLCRCSRKYGAVVANGRHEVETADCGIKAIKRAQVFHPQVVLLDIGLPDLDGYEVAKQLRLLPETRDAILIALIGYGRAEGRERSQSAGFNLHLLKPINLETLSALLTSSLSPQGNYRLSDK
jgi:CheY-like chemotaxis protein